MSMSPSYQSVDHFFRKKTYFLWQTKIVKSKFIKTKTTLRENLKN